MKFSNIPQLTSIGSYQVNMPLTYLERWIDEQIEDGLQLNPDFQRGHVWSESQQIAYVEYLLKGGKSNRTLYFNCPEWPKCTENDYVCVDGLQRITAIIGFLNNEIRCFGHYRNEYSDNIPFDVDVLININNLQTREEVLQWYIEMNEGGTPHTSTEIDRVKQLLEEEQSK